MMSYIKFQQKCGDCPRTWNAASGMVGCTLVAEAPVECPYCGSTNISKLGNGWKVNETNPRNTTGLMTFKERTLYPLIFLGLPFVVSIPVNFFVLASLHQQIRYHGALHLGIFVIGLALCAIGYFYKKRI